LPLAGKRDVKSQRLLLPQNLSLGPAAAQRLRQWMEPLATLGLELQDLGERRLLRAFKYPAS